MTVENQHDEAVALVPTQSLFAGNATVAAASEPTEPAPEAIEVASEDETLEALQETVSEPSESVVPDALVAVPEADAPHTEATVSATEQPKTLKELQAEKASLDAKIEAQQKEERKAVIDQIAVVVKTYNIPIQELVSALGGLPNPRKGEKAPVLYRDDKGNKWTGRGKLPNWLKDKNPDDYKVA